MECEPIPLPTDDQVPSGDDDRREFLKRCGKFAATVPPAVTMLLSALLAKLGTYGVVRVVLPLTPEAAVEYGLPVVGGLAAVGVVYAALCAYAQRDLKMLVAYSSVSHLAVLVLGLFTLTPEGVAGAVLHMVNHGLTVGAMFALLGFLAEIHEGEAT